MAFWNWSRTAATNATADPTIVWSEGQAPSSVNDSARAMMARTAEWRDDISGTITTGGTSTAYTVASNQIFTSLANMGGAMLAFVPHLTNGQGSPSVTLNIDGLGGKPLRSAPNVDIGAGTLIQGTPYVAAYNAADAAFYLQNFYGNPYNIPIGGLMPYLGASAPNSSFALPFGQAIGRVQYATLFALVGTTFGVGDGGVGPPAGGTFNIPDLRGLAIFGLDNMGGTARNAITVGGGNYDGTIRGQAGGVQFRTIAQNQLPNIAPTFSGSSPGTVTPTTNATVIVNTGGGQFGTSGGAIGTGSFNPITLPTPAGTISSINGGVTQQTMPTMPPSMVLPYILRVI